MRTGARARKARRPLYERLRALLDALLAGGVPHTLPWALTYGGDDPNGALHFTIGSATRPGHLLTIAEAAGLGAVAWARVSQCGRSRSSSMDFSKDCPLTRFKHLPQQRTTDAVHACQCKGCLLNLRFLLRERGVTLGDLVHEPVMRPKPKAPKS